MAVNACRSRESLRIWPHALEAISSSRVAGGAMVELANTTVDSAPRSTIVCKRQPDSEECPTERHCSQCSGHSSFLVHLYGSQLNYQSYGVRHPSTRILVWTL